MLHRWKTMELAEGIVLIDELGAHLHPRWRMRIVKALRAAFPRLQFLVSTHDPLCLRGLFNGEVVVLRRFGQAIAAITDLPSVEGMRVDQLLTSDYFGLDSVIDPELDDLFKRYYELKAKRRLSAADRGELGGLETRLGQYRVLGSTRRERMALEAADEFLARETRVRDDGERLQLKEETRRKIAQIWAEVE